MGINAYQRKICKSNSPSHESYQLSFHLQGQSPTFQYKCSSRRSKSGERPVNLSAMLAELTWNQRGLTLGFEGKSEKDKLGKKEALAIIVMARTKCSAEISKTNLEMV